MAVFQVGLPVWTSSSAHQVNHVTHPPEPLPKPLLLIQYSFIRRASIGWELARKCLPLRQEVGKEGSGTPQRASEDF